MLALVALTGPEHGELPFSGRLFYTPAGMIRSFRAIIIILLKENTFQHLFELAVILCGNVILVNKEDGTYVNKFDVRTHKIYAIFCFNDFSDCLILFRQISFPFFICGL